MVTTVSRAKTAEQIVKLVLNKAGVKRELLDTVIARKLAYYGHAIRKQGSCVDKRDNARNNARCTKARKATHGLDGQHQDVDRTPVEESIRMTEDRVKWRKYVRGVANPRIEDG